MNLEKITNTGTYPARNIVLKGLTNPAEKLSAMQTALGSLMGFTDPDSDALIPGPDPVGPINIVRAIDRALRGTTCFQNAGTIAADSAYNSDQLTELLNTPADGGLNSRGLAIEGGRWYLDPVVVGSRNRLVSRETGFLEQGRGRTTLQANPDATEPLFTITATGSMHCHGLQFWGEGTGDGIHCFHRPALTLPAETRNDLLIDGCQIYRFGGDGIRNELSRRNMSITGARSFILENGGYGIYNVGGEDIIIHGAMIGDNGKTNIYVDGVVGVLSIGNIDIALCDIFGGGKSDAGAGANRDFANIFIGGMVENSRIVDCENYAASRHTIEYGTRAFTGACHHTLTSGRFKTGSRFATNTYSHIYTDAGRLSVVNPIFEDARRSASTIVKHLLEIGPSVRSIDMSKFIAMYVDRDAYPIGDEEFQGSYGTSAINDGTGGSTTYGLNRVRRIGDAFDGGWKNRSISRSDSGSGGAWRDQFDGAGNRVWKGREDGAIQFGDDNSMNRRIAKGVGMGFGQSWHYGRSVTESWDLPGNSDGVNSVPAGIFYTWLRRTPLGYFEWVAHDAAPETDTEINTLGTVICTNAP